MFLYKTECVFIYQNDNEKHGCQVVFPLLLIGQHCSPRARPPDLQEDQHVQDGQRRERHDVHEHQVHPGNVGNVFNSQQKPF